MENSSRNMRTVVQFLEVRKQEQKSREIEEFSLNYNSGTVLTRESK